MFTCDIPQNYTIRESKQCENCPASFIRDAGDDTKFCPLCQSACEVQERLAFRAVARQILRRDERERKVGVSVRQARANARKRVAGLSEQDLLRGHKDTASCVKALVWGRLKEELAR